MANRKVKERRGSSEADPSLSHTETASGQIIESGASGSSTDGGQHKQHKGDPYADLLGEGPSMEEILASLEELLDEGGEVVPDRLPADMRPDSASPPQNAPSVTVQGFENDANLEQELLESLMLPAYGDGDFSEEADYVDLRGFELDAGASAAKETAQAAHAHREEEPAPSEKMAPEEQKPAATSAVSPLTASESLPPDTMTTELGATLAESLEPEESVGVEVALSGAVETIPEREESSEQEEIRPTIEVTLLESEESSEPEEMLPDAEVTLL
ncbi:MAG: hypothetical protein HQL88_04685, partial [Magnetococcales bacterium]|nr:hypothetical protein [Magnetococcales bacterium]